MPTAHSADFAMGFAHGARARKGPRPLHHTSTGTVVAEANLLSVLSRAGSSCFACQSLPVPLSSGEPAARNSDRLSRCAADVATADDFTVRAGNPHEIPADDPHAPAAAYPPRRL